jgi:hypothetical protein
MQATQMRSAKQMLIQIPKSGKRPAAKSTPAGSEPASPAVGVSQQTYQFISTLADLKGVSKTEIVNGIVANYVKSL